MIHICLHCFLHLCVGFWNILLRCDCLRGYGTQIWFEGRREPLELKKPLLIFRVIFAGKGNHKGFPQNFGSFCTIFRCLHCIYSKFLQKQNQVYGYFLQKMGPIFRDFLLKKNCGIMSPHHRWLWDTLSTSTSTFNLNVMLRLVSYPWLIQEYQMISARLHWFMQFVKSDIWAYVTLVTCC